MIKQNAWLYDIVQKWLWLWNSDSSSIFFKILKIKHLIIAIFLSNCQVMDRVGLFFSSNLNPSRHGFGKQEKCSPLQQPRGNLMSWAGCQNNPINLNFHLQKSLDIFEKNSADKIWSIKDIKVKKHAAVPVVRALYHGEEWLESNCWYNEQPLDTGPPEGPHAGAKWKKELCFKGSLKEEEQDGYVLHIFVVDARNATSSLWTMKYSTRSAMAKKTGNPGNSCMHITDSQSRVIARESGGNPGGYSCDDSYAFNCARTLLDKDSLSFLILLTQ